MQGARLLQALLLHLLQLCGHVRHGLGDEGLGGRQAQLVQVVREEAHVARAALPVVAQLRAVPAPALASWAQALAA